MLFYAFNVLAGMVTLGTLLVGGVLFVFPAVAWACVSVPWALIRTGGRRCPVCARRIGSEDRCRYCLADLTPAAWRNAPPPRLTDAD